jgi:hypothetical protein
MPWMPKLMEISVAPKSQIGVNDREAQGGGTGEAPCGNFGALANSTARTFVNHPTN